MGLKDDDEILKFFTCSHYDTCFVDFQNDKEDKYEGLILQELSVMYFLTR